jgi:Domain of unknown function (DUF4126)
MVTALSHIIPLAFASGLNLYATVAVLGLSSHYGLVSLPEQFRAFDNPVVIGAALTLYLIEFVADKVPWLDSVWDAVHTAVRPIGGALVATTALGDASPLATTLAALLGGSVAMTTHLTKAGTRAAVNTSPEPFSNWILSLGEDVLAIGISYVALQHPMLALTIAVALLIAIAAFSFVLVRALRRRLARGRGRAPSGGHLQSRKAG